MAEIQNLDKLVTKLRKAAADYGQDPQPSVVVGYTAEYAIWVHENRNPIHAGEPRPSGLGVFWGPRGRPGFLLDVAREMAGELKRMISALLVKVKNLPNALLLAGLRLQRESQLNVPVEYGNLRASAFTRLES